MEHDYEKLGAFYLGREVDAGSGEVTDDILLYDSKDLTTHGVIIGMTGSGKTGLGIGLLEEAAMDRVPVIAIDPKGDLGNLLLTFPDLKPDDFRPWINEDTARQKGMEPDAFAAAEADNWRKGLADWGQDGERIRRLRAQTDLSIFTPGSSAGLPISILRSFDAPPQALIDDTDAFRDRIQSTVTGLLGLIGIDADPIRSRDHILLSAILDEAWRGGRNLDLGGLIQAIQKPGFTRLGVMELESVYPAKDRFNLAMQVNALLASPGFQGWMEGEPLDIASLLYTEEGRPRISIFSIAHLGDAERMFFVTMLLSAVVAWMRGQAGTTSLRAIVYMDEIFGFFPPVANPPSKAPMLTLLKQARAFGVGLVLASQNPVDLDYKGLGNTGTWFIGRLQTDRDKARVLEALDGAMAGSTPIPRDELDRMLSGLGKRVFLLHSVHAGGPRLFTTRWAMSYLSGPLTTNQIRLLTRGRKVTDSNGSAADDTTPAPTEVTVPNQSTIASTSSSRPVLPPGITEFFVPTITTSGAVTYRPALLVAAEIRYSSVKLATDELRPIRVLVELEDGPIPFAVNGAFAVDLDIDLLETEPLAGSSFATLPPDATQAKNHTRWTKEAVRWMKGAFPIVIYESKVHRVFSVPGESVRDFRMRLATLGREGRDRRASKLRHDFKARFETLQNRLRAAEARANKSSIRSIQAMATTGITTIAAAFGPGGPGSGSLLASMFGAKSARTVAAVRGMGRVAQTRQDVTVARETVEAVEQQIAALEEEFQNQLHAIEKVTDAEEPLHEVVIQPALNAISPRLTALAWLPWGTDASGLSAPLWR